MGAQSRVRAVRVAGLFRRAALAFALLPGFCCADLRFAVVGDTRGESSADPVNTDVFPALVRYDEVSGVRVEGEINQEWLDSVLTSPSTRSKDHVFLFSHHPRGEMSAEFWDAVTSNGVLAYLHGHSHTYQRSRDGPTWHITVGTGGAPLHSGADEVRLYATALTAGQLAEISPVPAASPALFLIR